MFIIAIAVRTMQVSGSWLQSRSCPSASEPLRRFGDEDGPTSTATSNLAFDRSFSYSIAGFLVQHRAAQFNGGQFALQANRLHLAAWLNQNVARH